MNLPGNLYTVEQSRQLDRLAVEKLDLGNGLLMQRAGAAAFDTLRSRWPWASVITVVCGSGNNGGDGYVLAALARKQGVTVSVLCLGDLARQQGDALIMRRIYEKEGGKVEAFDGVLAPGQDLVVDALFGIGLARTVEGPWADAIEAINDSGVPVLALDIASGLQADSGRVLGCAVVADATIAFITLKAGMFTADGPDHCGHIYHENLGVPETVTASITPFAKRISQKKLKYLLPHRRQNTHKGQSGRVLVIGGGPGMPGAVRLAGEAALYTGAGMVTIATHPDHARQINAARPELIVHSITTAKDLNRLFVATDVIAVGPGLGRSEWAMQLLANVLESSRPKVLDADALNLLARDEHYSDEWILTPHPGEAATLLETTADAIQQHRFESADKIVKRYGGICVLKGAGSIISNGESRLVCDCGNAALSTAGTGDLLTGAIASFVAQGMALKEATATAVWVHGHAAGILAPHGERGWLASDFLPAMRAAVHELGFQEA
ncbi:MAG: NAD(P)H-hydrate dehydratase [Acidiferrobacterales bacterium]